MKINKKTYTSSQIYAAISTAIFLIIIYLPLSNELLSFSEKQEVSKRENRQLATKPKLDISKLDPYPSLFDKYSSDHFIFRDKFLQYHTYLNFFLFKQSPVPEKVAIGKDSWLFYTDKEKDVYEGKFNLSDEQISIIVNELKQRDSVYKKSGFAFVILIAPTKAEIYSDYLPKYIQRAEQTVTELIIEKIRKETDISVIYPKQTLLQKRNEFHIYHQFDNHWNQAGAFVAYQCLMNEINKKFPHIQTNTLDKENVILKNELTKGGNLANMIGLDNVLKEQNVFFEIKNKRATEAEKRNYTPTPGFAYPSEYEMVYKTSLTNLSKALIIRDSYAGALIPYLSESFGQSCFIFDAWQYGRNAEIIENEKPDIIILEIFEPHISNIIDNL